MKNAFSKLNIQLKDVMGEEEMSSPLPFQEICIPKIKSGKDYFFTAPKGSGKTMSIVISVIQRMLTLKAESAPRALVLVENKKAAQELEQIFKDITLMMEIEPFAIFDSQQIYNQKDTIYYGVDIVIATPKRLYELYTDTGINLKSMKMFIIDDAELLIKNKYVHYILKIAEGIPKKCQNIVFSDVNLERFGELTDDFMYKAELVEVV